MNKIKLKFQDRKNQFQNIDGVVLWWREGKKEIGLNELQRKYPKIANT